MNLSAYFQKIFDAEKELIWRLVHILAQKEALKQLAIQCEGEVAVFRAKCWDRRSS